MRFQSIIRLSVCLSVCCVCVCVCTVYILHTPHIHILRPIEKKTVDDDKKSTYAKKGSLRRRAAYLLVAYLNVRPMMFNIRILKVILIV